MNRIKLVDFEINLIDWIPVVFSGKPVAPTYSNLISIWNVFNKLKPHSEVFDRKLLNNFIQSNFCSSSTTCCITLTKRRHRCWSWAKVPPINTRVVYNLSKAKQLNLHLKQQMVNLLQNISTTLNFQAHFMWLSTKNIYYIMLQTAPHCWVNSIPSPLFSIHHKLAQTDRPADYISAHLSILIEILFCSYSESGLYYSNNGKGTQK